jgi:Kef-type K+ transport system membrane component KefB
MSALPPKADIGTAQINVRYGPIADIDHATMVIKICCFPETRVASPVNIHAYSDALVVLGTAGIVLPVVHRWGLNPILGYLGAGAILGPLGLGSFTKSFPFLYWLTITDAQNVALIADLGVVFLLFLIGLGLSFKRLATMRRLVFGLGSLQVLLTAGLLSFVTAALRPDYGCGHNY